MTEFSRVFETSQATQTRRLGELIGKAIDFGCVIALIGDLGSGKTCFTQGIATGLGVPENVPVTSPSYTLINEYHARLTLIHADLYRLNGQADLEDIGFYDLESITSVVVIEWAERANQNDFLPDLIINFTVKGDTGREIRLQSTGLKMTNLVNGLNFST